MATKIKNWFRLAVIEMMEARQRQVNRMIAEQGAWRHWK